MRRFASWTALSKLAKNSLFKTSYFWLIFVPLVAKALKASELNFIIFGANIDLLLELPFSWRLFFYSAVLFSLANVIYGIFCPGLIKDFRDFSHFKEEGREARHIYKAYVKALVPTLRIPAYVQHPMIEMLADFTAQNVDTGSVTTKEFYSLGREFKYFNQEFRIKPEKEQQAFWELRDILDVYHRNVRLVTFVAYVGGLVLFAFVIAQNVWFVFNKN